MILNTVSALNSAKDVNILFRECALNAGAMLKSEQDLKISPVLTMITGNGR